MVMAVLPAKGIGLGKQWCRVSRVPNPPYAGVHKHSSTGCDSQDSPHDAPRIAVHETVRTEWELTPARSVYWKPHGPVIAVVGAAAERQRRVWTALVADLDA
jgi:hypothetical protein